jgi:hypothetical protein
MGIVLQATTDVFFVDTTLPGWGTYTGNTWQARCQVWYPNTSTATQLIEQIWNPVTNSVALTNITAGTVLVTNTLVGNGVANNYQWSGWVNIPNSTNFTSGALWSARIRQISGNTGIVLRVEIKP